MNLQRSLALSLAAAPLLLFGQPGSDVQFRSLQIVKTAREAALGGKVLAIQDNDLNLALTTPSLLNKNLNNHLSLNYVNYFSDINFGHVAYAREHKRLPLTFCGAVKYIDYGDFTAADEYFNTGQVLHAADFTVQAGAGYALDSTFTVGANLKFIQSALESYKATGIGMDLSATYFNNKALLGATLLISDLGVVLGNYTGTKGILPFDISFGVSKKLAKSPLRFNIIADNLTRWDLTYQDKAQENKIDPLTGLPVEEEKPGFGDKFFRHIYGGTEIIFSKSLHFRVGYNYRRRQELKINEKPGTAGLSWGVGFRISRFHFSYARAKYHQAAAVNHFTISTNLATFGKN